ncbi:MAG: response regulator transcription factor [Bacteroidia bacterium]|nr:response regulator transcription factor [Bacteroidia bacterium]
MIHVSIVEDDLDIQRTLALIIDGTPGFACTHTYNDGESAIVGILKHRPDVVLMDVNLPGKSGIECVKQLKEERPEMDIIMLTVKSDDKTVFDSLCAGATGYLLKHTPPVNLLVAIKEVHEGGAPMSMEIARKVLKSFQPTPHSPLSERETDILRKLCEGENYKSIAEALFISGHTVRTHIKNIYSKLHVNSRGEAVKKAIKNKLI